MKIASVSPETLYVCTQSGLLTQLINEMGKDDVLLQVHVILPFSSRELLVFVVLPGYMLLQFLFDCFRRFKTEDNVFLFCNVYF